MVIQACRRLETVSELRNGLRSPLKDRPTPLNILPTESGVVAVFLPSVPSQRALFIHTHPGNISSSNNHIMADTITSPIPFADPTWHQDKSHPFYKDSHRTLQRFLRSYVDSEIAPNVAQWEKQGFVPEENFKKHASLGLLAAAVFPLPLDQLEGITLPGGISPRGECSNSKVVQRLTCGKEWDEFHDSIVSLVLVFKCS